MSWEKCVRYLTLNTAADIVDINEIMSKIVKNIIENPSDIKYRELKFSNKVVQNRIVSRKGGSELLQLFGFIALHKDGEKVLFLDIPDSSQVEIVVYDLNQSLDLLRFLIIKRFYAYQVSMDDDENY